MKKYRVYQVDAFTTEPFTGNAAGVVPEADGLTEAQMQQIARELNNSETAFLFSGKPGEYDVHVRFFTPTQEVPLCGHGTVASHCVRAMELGLEHSRVIQKSGAGQFPVEVLKEEGKYRVVMFQGEASFGEELSENQRERLLNALGLEKEDLIPDCPIQSVTTGAAKVMVPIRSLDRLHSLHPDMEGLVQLSRDIGVNGYHVFTLHPGNDPLVHCRMFAPANGNNEDPVTGTANGPLGAYLVQSGLVPNCGKEFSFTAAQGEAMGRPGTMEVRVQLKDGRPGEICIIGDAVVVFRTEIEVDVA